MDGVEVYYDDDGDNNDEVEHKYEGSDLERYVNNFVLNVVENYSKDDAEVLFSQFICQKVWNGIMYNCDDLNSSISFSISDIEGNRPADGFVRLVKYQLIGKGRVLVHLQQVVKVHNNMLICGMLH